MNKIFDIYNFNLIKDNENYYFFRALNMADIKDLEEGIILDKNGNLEKIRTDRQRYKENLQNEKPKYNKEDKISLEQIYDHIKEHYRKDTNCISLSCNSNVSISYGRGLYKDKYIMIKVPKNEFGEKVIFAGQYMLDEIEKIINKYISDVNIDSKLKETLFEIDNSKTLDEIKNKIKVRYKSKEVLNFNNAKLKKKIRYKQPVARIINHKVLNKEQLLEINKIIAKLTLLERKGHMPPIISDTDSNTLLIKTIKSAFTSLELIHYGQIEKEEIIDIPKEIVDIFSLLQPIEGQDKQTVDDL